MKRLEDFIQYKCAEWLREQGVLFFHVPNAGKRGFYEGGRLKAMGMLAGVHDLVILLDQGQVLFVELKTIKGRIEPAQKDFHEKIIKRGYRHQVIQAKDAPDAVQQLAELLLPLLQNHS